MSTYPFTYKQEVYLQFMELDRNTPRNIVQYFDANRSSIALLDPDQYFEVLATYAGALFDMGLYTPYIQVSEEVLFLSIDQNVFLFEGEDIYCTTLFRKAAAHFNNREQQTAEEILCQLIRIYPDQSEIRDFYRKVLSRNRGLSQKTRALTVAMALCAACIIALELLAVRPFFPAWTDSVEWTRNILLIGSILTYIAGELYTSLRAAWLVGREVRAVRRQKDQGA